jgi:predicted RNA-binding protein YlxR (DUF448 family)
LVRVVHTPEGKLEIDATGKSEGRGAYLCKEQACWEKALKGAQLERALKVKINRDDIERLDKNWSELLKELSGA